MATNIKFRIDEEEALVYIPFGESLSKAKNFASAIAKYTNAAIPHVWATICGEMSIAEKSGDIQSLNLYAHLFFRRAKDDKLYALKIHAPNYGEMFNDDQEVPEVVGNAIAGYFSALAGETFTFHSGALAGEMA